MDKKYTGHCACGQVTYGFDTEPTVAIQQASACYCWLRGSCGSLFQAAGGRSWWHGCVLCPMSLACRLRRSLPSCRMACWLSGWRKRTG